MNSAPRSASPDTLARAQASHQAGRLAEAERSYREALAADASCAPALHGLGLVALQAGQADAAEDLLRRAAAIAPDAVVLNNWGIALARTGRAAQARLRFESAIALAPAYVDARVNLGSALADSGELQTAEAHLREALARAPRSVEAHCALARVLLALRRPSEAESALRSALALRPTQAGAENLLGNALREQGRLAEALESYRRACALRPDHPEAWQNCLVAQNADPSASAAQAFESHRAFGRRFSPGQAASAPSLAHRRPGRLRIGYVSADFRAHALAAFIEPVLAHHDRARFEVTAYSNATAQDATTARIRNQVERFTPIAGLTDAQLVERVRADGIDVLVDLSGHTAGNRLLAFASRAAPIQVTWLGYPNSTGLEAMDARLTDERADPPGAEALHTERLVRLPVAWCYQPWPDAPGVAARRADGSAIVFGAMSNPAKLNDDLLGAWTRILSGLPGSRIRMHLPDDDACRRRIVDRFETAGIGAERLSFFPRLAISSYLAQYGEIDIALDTFPCAGATTTLDALWMGVPVLSLAGDRPYGRSGASLLGALGLDAWICGTSNEYVSRAIDHARRADGLATLRGELRARLRSSPIMDAPARVRDLESAFVALCEARGYRRGDA